MSTSRPSTESAFSELCGMLPKIQWVQAVHPSPTHTGHTCLCPRLFSRKTMLNESMLLFWLSLVQSFEQVCIFLANEGEPVAAV